MEEGRLQNGGIMHFLDICLDFLVIFLLGFLPGFIILQIFTNLGEEEVVCTSFAISFFFYAMVSFSCYLLKIPQQPFALAREDELNVTVPNRFGEIVKGRVVKKIWIVCYENISTRERVAHHGLEDFPGIEIALPKELTALLTGHNFRLDEERLFPGQNPAKIFCYIR